MNFPRNTFIQVATQSGRSSDFINKTLVYADNLIKNELPVLFSLQHFAQILGVDILDIQSMVRNRGFHYSYYLMKKKSGGVRRIIAPHKNIRYLQDWIKLNILDKIKVHPACTGFTKNKSILSNAQHHVNADTILNIDLENFFETINERRVYGVFRRVGYHPNLAVVFAKICTVTLPEEKFDSLEDNIRPHFEEYFKYKEAVLVQGAPTSPLLANIVCTRLDNRFTKLANKLGVSYSRYADDITFSGDRSNLPNLRLIQKIINDENFKLNPSKIGVYGSGQKQIVTGLLINESIRITKKYKKEIFRHLFFCKKFGPTKHFERVSSGKSYAKEWLIGKILFVNSIEPLVAKKMFKMVKEINWEV